MLEKKYLRLAELHSHLGAAVQPHIMWSIAHEQGIRLPTKNYWEFEEMMTVRRRGKFNSFFEINQNLFKLSELIQSSPLAIEPAVHHTISGAYRNNNVVLHEIRFCPAKRNRGGERDLDYIILAAARGLEKALLEFPEVKAGLIIALDREFDYRVNSIMYEKAKKYRHRGIVGIDLGGPQNKNFKIEELQDIFLEANQIGLGTTIHTGEEGDLSEMAYCVAKIKPRRIGHGFMAGQKNDRKILRQLSAQGTYLEICPTTNLLIGHIRDYAEMKKVYRCLYSAGVRLTINTDDPEFFGTNIKKEINQLLKNNIFNEKEIAEFIANSFAATFIKN